MKFAHWSQIFLTFVGIEVIYDDNSRQTWNYDCSQFATIEDVKANMAADFNLSTDRWKDCVVYIVKNNESHTLDIDMPKFENGEQFAEIIFNYIGEVLEWQPVVVS